MHALGHVRAVAMRVYIAGHNQQQARDLADSLHRMGHAIASTWVYDPCFGLPRTPEERSVIAARELDQIASSDLLVSLAAPENVPGGKHVELGFALGRGVHCVHVGRQENIFHAHPLIERFESFESLLAALADP